MSPRIRPEDPSSPDPPLAWLNPFWTLDLSFTVPEDVDECLRRLGPLGGKPNWFQGGFTSGWVERHGFRLVARFRNRGIYVAVAVARGTLRANGSSTEVRARVRYAPFPLVWFAFLVGLLTWLSVAGHLDAYWMRFFAITFPVSWVVGIWLTHRIAERLVGTLVLALDPSAADEEDA